MIEDALLEGEEMMEKALGALRNEFSKIRSGRANPELFTSLIVDYYGSPTQMQQIASVTVPEARTVIITPYDRTAMKDIEKAIRDADLGVNPTDDGQVLRINLPALTEERRKEYVKLARTKAEESKISVRSARRKAKDVLEKIKKDGEAGEDEVERAEKELEALTKRFTDQVDALLEGKEKDLMEI
ncbi:MULTISPECIES: ribosome recycling factor [Trueperella]|uniref:Ribosome-recycling factor n=1 Tax=Trueperella bernardiae TaxID=59561 RepID=A0A0W1KL92_9ACTO|nr:MULTISPECIES: ribosome recycling factor [Trueperella]KTF04754.1 Ribosome-recycling factor [Trueperella bernardiae]MCM3907332.1 ribosome recycling factor [Trueperella bernardiae]MDK8601301.1 ribosome recycling factor [Trueperella bernardiae]MDV6238190.1 ribosome recycling factor [Trueperella bernardiae]OCW61140.1 ribosome-recycling factor [Trueperella bernardiae]